AGDVTAHVVRARDHPVGAADHPPLDAMDVGLRVLVDPALMAAVLGRVDRDEPRSSEAFLQALRRGRYEPVVRVHEIELEALDDRRVLPGEDENAPRHRAAGGYRAGGARRLVRMSGHVEANRAHWTRWAADYVEPGRANWAQEEPTWGIWGVPEAQLHMLPD